MSRHWSLIVLIAFLAAGLATTADERGTAPPPETLAMDLDDPEVICAGTGEGYFREQERETVLAVDPLDPDIVFAGGVDLHRSDDGGASWGPIAFSFNYPPSAHADHHVILFHPGYDGAQDNGALLGSDESGVDGWIEVHRGDGGYVAIDPDDPRIVYSERHNLVFYKSTDGGRSFRQSMNGLDEDWFLFISPFAMDPNDSRRLWLGAGHAWRTNDGADHWEQASSRFPSRISAVAVAPGDSDRVVLAFEDDPRQRARERRRNRQLLAALPAAGRLRFLGGLRPRGSPAGLC